MEDWKSDLTNREPQAPGRWDELIKDLFEGDRSGESAPAATPEQPKVASPVIMSFSSFEQLVNESADAQVQVGRWKEKYWTETWRNERLLGRFHGALFALVVALIAVAVMGWNLWR